MNLLRVSIWLVLLGATSLFTPQSSCQIDESKLRATFTEKTVFPITFRIGSHGRPTVSTFQKNGQPSVYPVVTSISTTGVIADHQNSASYVFRRTDVTVQQGLSGLPPQQVWAFLDGIEFEVKSMTFDDFYLEIIVEPLSGGEQGDVKIYFGGKKWRQSMTNDSALAAISTLFISYRPLTEAKASQLSAKDAIIQQQTNAIENAKRFQQAEIEKAQTKAATDIATGQANVAHSPKAAVFSKIIGTEVTTQIPLAASGDNYRYISLITPGKTIDIRHDDASALPGTPNPDDPCMVWTVKDVEVLEDSLGFILTKEFHGSMHFRFVYGQGWQSKVDSQTIVRDVSAILFIPSLSDTPSMTAREQAQNLCATRYAKKLIADQIRNQSHPPKAGNPSYKETTDWITINLPKIGPQTISADNCLLVLKRTTDTPVPYPYFSDAWALQQEKLTIIPLGDIYLVDAADRGDSMGYETGTLSLTAHTKHNGDFTLSDVRDYDSVDLSKRLAKALNHAASLCTTAKSKANEPF